MKKYYMVFLVIFIFGFAAVANATLYDMGNGLIYDSDWNLTWLQDANYGAGSDYDDGLFDTDGRMTWDSAMAWAENLDYGGHNDWRLPTALNFDGTGPDYAYDVHSEIGHLYFYNEGGKSFSDFFYNVMPNPPNYWTSTEYAPYPNLGAWSYDITSGFQTATGKTQRLYAWAVRDGGSVPIPEPATMLLLGSGLAGLGIFRRKFRKL